jgi:hypothetical protein
LSTVIARKSMHFVSLVFASFLLAEPVHVIPCSLGWILDVLSAGLAGRFQKRLGWNCWVVQQKTHPVSFLMHRNKNVFYRLRLCPSCHCSNVKRPHAHLG